MELIIETRVDEKSRKGLIVLNNSVLCFVAFCWLFQLALHQVWRCIIVNISWDIGFYSSVMISLIPLLFWRRIKRDYKPYSSFLEKEDAWNVAIIFLLSIGVWLFFAYKYLFLPIHTYGDEGCHSDRVVLMIQDFKFWFQNFSQFSKTSPPYYNYYMMYPSLSYFFPAVLNSLFNIQEPVVLHRAVLVVNYFLTSIFTYLLAINLSVKRKLAFLIALIPVSSALLIAYTISYYIEFHYVPVILFCYYLLTLAEKYRSSASIVSAVLLASCAPILRETALPATLGVLLSSVILKIKITKTEALIKKTGAILVCCFVCLLPFILFYLAKSNYTNNDRERVSTTFLFLQDYKSLFFYSFLYLGPFLFLIIPYLFSKKKEKNYLFIGAILSLLLALIMQSMFLPGYMPWSRNYLFYYAPCLLLLISAGAYYSQQSKQREEMVYITVVLAVVFNLIISKAFLQTNRLFHESEVVLDVSPIAEYVNSHPEKFVHDQVFYQWRLPYSVIHPLSQVANLFKVEYNQPGYLFPTFEKMKSLMPKDARFFLFFFMKNESLPRAFSNHAIVEVPPPTLTELGSYKILAASFDPFSSSQANGVYLIEIPPVDSD